MDPIVQELADKQAIRDVLYTYCRAVDRIDRPLGYSVFHEDATADYGPRFPKDSARAVIDRICNDHSGLLSHSHQVTNIFITLDGNRAGSEACMNGTLRMERDGRVMHMSVWARYIDQWEMREGRWAISHRQVIFDHDEIREVTPMGQPQLGRRDRDDPSYAVLGDQA